MWDGCSLRRLDRIKRGGRRRTEYASALRGLFSLSAPHLPIRAKALVEDAVKYGRLDV